jgi:hypothetical protein
MYKGLNCWRGRCHKRGIVTLARQGDLMCWIVMGLGDAVKQLLPCRADWICQPRQGASI